MNMLRKLCFNLCFYRDNFNSENGFTLLEVLIASVIIALAFVPLLTTQNRSLDRFNESAQITRATLLAKEKLVETELKGFPPLEETEGDFAEEENSAFSWRKSVTETFSKKLRRVELTVFWFEGNREKQVSLVEYLNE